MSEKVATKAIGKSPKSNMKKRPSAKKDGSRGIRRQSSTKRKSSSDDKAPLLPNPEAKEKALLRNEDPAPPEQPQPNEQKPQQAYVPPPVETVAGKANDLPSQCPVPINENAAPAPSPPEQQEEAQPPAQAPAQQSAQPSAPLPPVQEQPANHQGGALPAQQQHEQPIAPLPQPTLRNQTLNPQQMQAQRLQRVSHFEEIEVIDIVAAETDGTQEATREVTREEKKLKKKKKKRKSAKGLLKSGIKTVAKPGIFVAKTAQRGMEKGVNKITGGKKRKDKDKKKKQQMTGDSTQEVLEGAEATNDITTEANVNPKKLKKEKSRKSSISKPFRTSTRKSSIGFSTAEYESLKAKHESVTNLNRRYESRVAQLNLEIMSLEETIEEKDEVILLLRERLKEIASTRNEVNESRRESISKKREKKRQLEQRMSQMKQESSSMASGGSADITISSIASGSVDRSGRLGAPHTAAY